MHVCTHGRESLGLQRLRRETKKNKSAHFTNLKYSKSETRCSYKIVFIRKKRVIDFMEPDTKIKYSNAKKQNSGFSINS